MIRQRTALATTDQLPDTYPAFLADLKQRITAARLRASLSVNRELVLLYWSIGREILTRQRDEGWGTKVIGRLAADLRLTFPEMTGISSRNLQYMRSLAEAWPDEPIVQQLVAQLPWGHNTHLLDLVKAPGQREWYARQTIENGWSRNVLVHQIESRLFERQGGALTNFERTLPEEQSDLAQQLIKDPYSFDFLALAPKASAVVHSGVGQRLFIRWEPVSPRGRWPGFPPRSAVLSPALAVLRRFRTEGRTVQAGVRRQDELLSVGSR